MSRNRKEVLRFRPAVAALATAIETKGAAALALQHADEFHRLIALRDRTVYSALAHALGQSAEAVRRELRRYISGERMCTAQKCLKLVGAATELGWISPDAHGTGAEEWVAWCRWEKDRLDREKSDRVAKARMRRHGALAERVQDLVSFAFKSSELGEHADDAAALLNIVVEAALTTLLRSERHWEPNAAKSIRTASLVIHRRLAEAELEIERRYQRQRDYDEASMAEIHWQARQQEASDQDLERERRVSRLVVEASKQRPLELSERALQLGIGEERRLKILSSLETGEKLTEDESLRLQELIESYVKSTAGVYGRWVLRPLQGAVRSAERGRTWAEAREEIEARRARGEATPASAKKSAKRKRKAVDSS